MRKIHMVEFYLITIKPNPLEHIQTPFPSSCAKTPDSYSKSQLPCSSPPETFQARWVAWALCNLQARLCFQPQGCCNLADLELEAKCVRHVLPCPVTEAIILPSTSACGTFHTFPDKRFWIYWKVIDLCEDPPPFPQMWIDRRAGVFEITPVRVVGSGVTSGA